MATNTCTITRMERLTDLGVGDLSDAALAQHLVDLHRQLAVLDAEIVATTGVFDARSCAARDGARSTPAWATARTGAPHHRVKVDVALARALRSMPATDAAFAVGRLSRAQVDALVTARDGLEGAFDLVEEILVDEVAGATAAAGIRFLRRWAAEVRERLALDDEAAPPADDDGSKLHLSQTFAGRWALDATLDPEQGEVISNALDAEVDAMFRDGRFTGDDGLLPSERRAVALVELVTRGSSGGDDDGTARPLVVGVIDLRPDGSVASDVAVTDRGGVVGRTTAERWLCEGTFQEVVIGPGADDLRLGRKARVASRGQRRALRVRDGHCAFPGCSVPPEQCQAHHIVEWEHGGPTDLDNLVLVCRFHHRVIHDQGFAIERTGGRTIVRRPDRTQVTGTRSVRCDHRRVRPPPPLGRDPDDAHLHHLARRRIHDLVNQAARAHP